MQSFRIEERNDFYIAPFALIALLGLGSSDDVVPRLRRVLLIARARRGRPARWRCRSPGSSTRRPSPTRSGCCRGGGCRTGGSISGRCASSRSGSGSPPPRWSSCRDGSRSSRWRSSRSTSCSRRRSSRTAGTVSGRPRSAASSPASASHPRLDRPAGRPRRRRLVRLALRGRDAAALEQRVLQPQRPDRLHRRRARPGRRRAAGDAGARATPTDGSRLRPADAARPLRGLLHRHRRHAAARDPGIGLRLPGERADRHPDARQRAVRQRHLVGAASHVPQAALHAAGSCRCGSAPTRTSSPATRS